MVDGEYHPEFLIMRHKKERERHSSQWKWRETGLDRDNEEGGRPWKWRERRVRPWKSREKIMRLLFLLFTGK